MNVSVVTISASVVQLRAQTLWDHTAALVTMDLWEMERQAASRLVSGILQK